MKRVFDNRSKNTNIVIKINKCKLYVNDLSLKIYTISVMNIPLAYAQETERWSENETIGNNLHLFMVHAFAYPLIKFIGRMAADLLPASTGRVSRTRTIHVRGNHKFLDA